MRIPPATLVRYEAVRAHVLAGQPSPEYGWGLFVRRGMLAWGLQCCPEPAAARPPRLKTPASVVDNRSPVIAILASMVLALHCEVPEDA